MLLLQGLFHTASRPVRRKSSQACACRFVIDRFVFGKVKGLDVRIVRLRVLIPPVRAQNMPATGFAETMLFLAH